ncbi:hypothetical protein M7I_1249 [Glarea lozoyensis 74030]|uniref:Rhodopsin domain-containing protein n=1 Tax=Glarea lozoyensis (strain ATCC 74030 / MF5533) TaxID=1104152 RepID=H0EFH4_GLAL7|nr:hypothetical protein M7I_1249 [Glarea lozoyensis 74030]
MNTLSNVLNLVAKDGWGRHSYDVPLAFLDDSYTDRQFASQILISPVKFAITSAIIILYVRLFGTLKWVRWTSYFLYAFLFLIQVQNIGIALYWYIPRAGDVNNIQAALMRTAKTASSAIVNAVCSTVVDIILFLIPIIIVPSLNMTRRKTQACYAVFGFGALIIVVDCVGIAYKTYGVLGKNGDPFWVGMISIITVSQRSDRSDLPSVEGDTDRYAKSNRYDPSSQLPDVIKVKISKTHLVLDMLSAWIYV